MRKKNQPGCKCCGGVHAPNCCGCAQVPLVLASTAGGNFFPGLMNFTFGPTPPGAGAVLPNGWWSPSFVDATGGHTWFDYLQCGGATVANWSLWRVDGQPPYLFPPVSVFSYSIQTCSPFTLTGGSGPPFYGPAPQFSGSGPPWVVCP